MTISALMLVRKFDGGSLARPVLMLCIFSVKQDTKSAKRGRTEEEVLSVEGG